MISRSIRQVSIDISANVDKQSFDNAKQQANILNKELKRDNEGEEDRGGFAKQLFKGAVYAKLAHTTGKIIQRELRKAVSLDFLIKDIQKVNHTLGYQQIEADLFDIAPTAPGKSFEDLAKTYKLYAQTLGDNKLINPFMKLTEKLSISFDMLAEETANKLSVLYNNLGYSVEGMADLGDKASYGHHHYGNATVKDILTTTARASGLTKSFGIDNDFVMAWNTLLLNAGFRNDEPVSALKRLVQRISMGETWKSRKQYVEAVRAIGYTPEQLSVSAKEDMAGTILNVMSRIEEAKQNNKNIVPLWYQLGSMYQMPQLTFLQSHLAKLSNLYSVFKGETKNDNGATLWKGEAQRAYDTIMSSSEKSIQRFKTSLDMLERTIGQTILPTFTTITDHLNDFLVTLNQNKCVIRTITATCVALAGVLAQLLAIRVLIKAIKSLKPVWDLIGLIILIISPLRKVQFALKGFLIGITKLATFLGIEWWVGKKLDDAEKKQAEMDEDIISQNKKSDNLLQQKIYIKTIMEKDNVKRYSDKVEQDFQDRQKRLVLSKLSGNTELLENSFINNYNTYEGVKRNNYNTFENVKNNNTTGGVSLTYAPVINTTIDQKEIIEQTTEESSEKLKEMLISIGNMY